MGFIRKVYNQRKQMFSKDFSSYLKKICLMKTEGFSRNGDEVVESTSVSS